MNNHISSEVTAELKRRRIINTITLTVPRLGILAAIIAAIWWEKTVTPFDIAICVGMYILTIWGVSVGYHRLFSHRAFKTGPVMRALIGIAASISTQGPIISWVSHLRQHHIYSDQPGDVHSPHLHGEDLWGRIQGAWHSHFGWMIGASWVEPLPYTKDLKNDPVIQAVDRFHLVWILLSLVLPTAIGGAVFGSWEGALRGLIWGGAIRIMLSFQGTISVNSICHLLGNRPFGTSDLSRNNALIAFITLGEGWHNNHHAFPYSAQFGIHWWQYDFAWWTIAVMERLGLVWDVKRPTDKDLNGQCSEELAIAVDA